MTLARWWVVHKERIDNWQQCKRLSKARFEIETEYTAQNYTRLSCPIDHVT